MKTLSIDAHDLGISMHFHCYANRRGFLKAMRKRDRHYSTVPAAKCYYHATESRIEVIYHDNASQDPGWFYRLCHEIVHVVDFTLEAAPYGAHNAHEFRAYLVQGLIGALDQWHRAGTPQDPDEARAAIDKAHFTYMDYSRAYLRKRKPRKHLTGSIT